MAKKPTTYIEIGKKKEAIMGYDKKELPDVVKKTVKRKLKEK